MSFSLKRFTLASQRARFGLSSWLLVGVPLIVGLVVGTLSFHSAQREREQVEQNFLDRGNAFIWALEAGARAGQGMQGRVLQPLVQESAKQAGIAYMAVVDGQGRVVAHSDPEQIGRVWPAYAQLAGPDQVAWRLEEGADEPVFEVFRGFSPLAPERRAPGKRLEKKVKKEAPLPPKSGLTHLETGQIAIIGFDHQPFQEALDHDVAGNAQRTLIVAALGIGCCVCLFLAHAYALSRHQLKSTKALASEVVASLPAGLVAADRAGVISLANEAAREMLGLPQAGTARLNELPGLDWGAFMAKLKGGATISEEEALFSTDEKQGWVSVSASSMHDEDGLFLGYLFILRNIDEMKKLQAQLRRSEKLSAIGKLAAGVAHEIRNPLSSIKGLATYVAAKLPDGKREKLAARTMIEEVDRLNRVVSELLDFSRPTPPRLVDRAPLEVVEHALRLARADLESKKAVVEVRQEDGVPPVRMNPERITQALLNILLNAAQAIEAGGRIEVTIKKEAHAVLVSVADNGPGMTEEVMAEMFTPYFTTKPAGTGLGLAISHQIMESHNGAIRVKSAPGEGCVMTLVFPQDEAA